MDSSKNSSSAQKAQAGSIKSSMAASKEEQRRPRKVASSSSMIGRLCPFMSSSSSQSPANPEKNTKKNTTTKSMTKGAAPPVARAQIPQPKRIPVLGHVHMINMENPLETYNHYTEKLGPIYKMDFFGDEFIILGNHELVHDACDEKRFKKCIENEIRILRAGVGDGLFTSTGEDEENWGIAHRILVPAFGPLMVRNMYPGMHDTASQLALKWARHGSQNPINVTDDFTRLTLDTIALCAMGFRFNSYYSSEVHPFVDAMYGLLRGAGAIAMRPPGVPSLMFRKADKQFKKDIAVLRVTAQQVLESRKAEMADGARLGDDAAPQRNDLLTAMLESVDKKTGKKMTDESIIDNLITFLVAGHETTASSLSFILYRLLTHPEVYRKLQDEVDEVVGTDEITVNHIQKLKYMTAVIRETMRFHSSIPFISREALEDTVLGGKYHIKAQEQMSPLIEYVHRDPAVYGPDANEYKPERMLDGPFDERMKKFPHCWMPFGSGVRACIGRPFAWQEIMLALALLLQNLKFVKHDPGYELKIAMALTIKPDKFLVRAMLRDGMTTRMLESRLAGKGAAAAAARHGNKNEIATSEDDDKAGPTTTTGGSNLKPLTVLYGSNSGTCEFMAQQLAVEAARRGFTATIDSMDAATEALPTDRPVVIITASYEGEPPHNAEHFVKWLESVDSKEKQRLEGVRYAVFGCGHRDWAQTFQRIPTLVDERMAALGAHRLVKIGSTDAKERDMFSDFEAWEDDLFWPAVDDGTSRNAAGEGEATDPTGGDVAGLQVTLSTPRATILHHDVHEAKVVSVRALAHFDGDGNEKAVSKGHVEIQLPPGTQYSAGDYLAVLPHNPRTTVARVMRRFELAWDAHATIRAPGPTVLPTGGSVPIAELLTSYVELGVAATRRNITTLSQIATDPDVKAKLQHLATEGYDDLVKAKQLSVLGIAEQFPSLELPLGTFLSLLLPMRVRQYSISSSPLANPASATITFSVLDMPSASGQGRHVGVCSSYLASLAPGNKIQASIRSGLSGFRLPSPDAAATTPIIMIAAGTGIAPFRAFLQHRAEVLGSGGARTLAPALLFFGCRSTGAEDLYRDELDAWEAAGAVEGVFRAYSRESDKSGGCRYVQDRLWAERRRVAELWEGGARMYVCGSARMGEGVKEAMLKVLVEKGGESGSEGMTAEEAEAYFQSMRNQRYSVDVFD